MGDDWEEDDWDAAADNFAAKVAVAKPVAAETKGAAILAGVNEPDNSKFEDEEEEEEDDEDPKHKVVAPQPKKKEEKKYTKGELIDDTPLDDPELEKQRRQRLIEQADYAAAKELFGDVPQGINLDVFLPKSVKDFEDYAQTIAVKYCHGHKENKNYKAFVKALVKQMCAPLSSAETKDIETCIAGFRSDKIKQEKEELAAKAAKGKKNLNMGKGKSAGLDDYIYDDSADHDDYDFM